MKDDSSRTTNADKPAAIIPTIGETYFAGNSLYPRRDRVLGIVCWSLVPAREQDAHRTLGPQHGYDPETLEYVLYRSSNCKRLQASPARVFSHTRYESASDMGQCYALRGERPEAA